MAKRNEPIRHTCPDIDRIKKMIQDVSLELEKVETMDDLNISSWVSDLDSISSGNNCELEALRDSNSTLRNWGNDLVSDLEQQDKEIDRLNDEIREIERQLSVADDEISELKDHIRNHAELD